MTHHSFFDNFFVALAASLSDDAFLAFAEAVLHNLKRDGATYQAEIAFLGPLVVRLRAAHAQRGPIGRSASAAHLRTVVRAFLAWAKLTNTRKVFPAFPDRTQNERIRIFPGGMDALYHADQASLLPRARHYLDAISVTYGAQTGVTAAEAQAQYDQLETALTGRSAESNDQRKGSAAIDEVEQEVCEGLYLAYAALLHTYFRQPRLAYAYFPFPQTKGEAADGNLPSLPQ